MLSSSSQLYSCHYQDNNGGKDYIASSDIAVLWLFSSSCEYDNDDNGRDWCDNLHYLHAVDNDKSDDLPHNYDDCKKNRHVKS